MLVCSCATSVLETMCAALKSLGIESDCSDTTMLGRTSLLHLPILRVPLPPKNVEYGWQVSMELSISGDGSVGVSSYVWPRLEVHLLDIGILCCFKASESTLS